MRRSARALRETNAATLEAALVVVEAAEDDAEMTGCAENDNAESSSDENEKAAADAVDGVKVDDDAEVITGAVAAARARVNRDRPNAAGATKS